MNNLSKILWGACDGMSIKAILSDRLESLMTPGAFLDEIDIVTIYGLMKEMFPAGKCGGIIADHIMMMENLSDGQFIMYEIPEEDRQKWIEFLGFIVSRA